MVNKSTVIFVLILVQVLFGLNFAASKYIVGRIDPFLWSNIRFFIAGVIMLLATSILKRPHPKPTKEFFLPLIPLSLLGMALGQGLFLFGLRHTTSINTAILTSTIPILTIVIVILRKQEKLTLQKLIGLVFSFIGVIFIKDLANLEFSSQTIFGDLLVLCGAMSFALFLNFGKKFLMSHDNLWVTSYMFLISAISMLLLNLTRGINFDFNLFMESSLLVPILYSIIGATVLTYFLNNWALKRTSSGAVALFIYLQPIIAGFVGYFLLGEIITFRMILCSVLIITGLLINLLAKN